MRYQLWARPVDWPPSFLSRNAGLRVEVGESFAVRGSLDRLCLLSITQQPPSRSGDTDMPIWLTRTYCGIRVPLYAGLCLWLCFLAAPSGVVSISRQGSNIVILNTLSDALTFRSAICPLIWGAVWCLALRSSDFRIVLPIRIVPPRVLHVGGLQVWNSRLRLYDSSPTLS